MAALAIAAAGAAIGGSIATGVVAFGVTGAQLGWMAGSLLASAFSPTQRSEGPRLGDLSVSSSAYGSVLPYVQGHPRIAGQIVWASAKREISTTTEQGKGGGGSEYTSYTYEVDLLIELTDNTIAGINRAWSSGDLIWSADASATASTIIASGVTNQWQRMSVYTGASDQLPDPTYEAAVGTENAPAYRGRGTVFIQGLQLGSGGQLPNLTFEVLQVASQTDTTTVFSFDYGGTGLIPVKSGSYPDGTWFSHTPDGSAFSYYKSVEAGPFSFQKRMSLPYGYRGAFAIWANSQRAIQISMEEGVSYGSSYGLHLVDPNSGIVQEIYRYVPGAASGVIQPALRQCAFDVVSEACIVTGIDATKIDKPYVIRANIANQIGPIANLFSLACYDSVIYALHNDGQWKVSKYDLSGSLLSSALGTGSGFPSAGSSGYNYSISAGPNGVYVLDSYRGRLWNVESSWIEQGVVTGSGPYVLNDIDGVFYATDNYVSFGHTAAAPSLFNFFFRRLSILSATERTIQQTVSELCSRSGLSPSQFDASALASISKPVRAMSISQVSSARSVLDMLAGCYFFESVLSDKIYFRPRGGATVATLAYDDLGVSLGDGSDSDPLALRQANELEIPAQIAITYSNIDGDYQTDTQYSDRLLTGQDSTSVLQLPMGFTASEAKAIADATLMDQAAGSIRTSISVGRKFTRLEPSDVVIMTGDDGSTYRMRLLKRTDADGVLSYDAVLDDATVLAQAGITSGGTTPQTVVASLPDTILELLDIPILRDADNWPGHYFAVKGSNPSWHSAGLYQSLDDNTYSLNTTISSQTVMGVATTALGAWAGGAVFDEVNTVTVSVGSGQLASATRDDILNNQSVNAAVIAGELLQFRDALLVSSGVYKLTGFLRGRRGTEWSTSSHAAFDRFVLLGNAGMRFIELQAAELGRLRYYKAASAGQRLTAATAKSLTPMGVGLETFSPVDVRADRATTDTIIGFKRRTRLSTRLVGPLPISAPLGETVESYEVEVYSSAAFTTLKRTLASSTQSATYTSAQQIADFGGNQTILYLRVYQLSATVGRGYAAQVAV